MKNLFQLILLASICFTSFASVKEVQSYINSVKHYELIDDQIFLEKRSPMPQELRYQLTLILLGPLGDLILRVKDQATLEFVEVNDPRDAFGVNGNKIYYMKSVLPWYTSKRDAGHLPAGSYMEEATLGTLLAHEIGHTEVGRLALGLPIINSYLRTDIGNGRVTFIFSREMVRKEELRAVRLFENPYRQYIGIPLRESYYKAGDVTVH